MAKTNQEWLTEIMSEGELDVRSVALLASVSPHTVVSWLRPKTSKSHRDMPDRAVEMLKIKLSVKKQTGTYP